MKKLVIICIFFLLPAAFLSQAKAGVGFGIRGGLNFSSFPSGEAFLLNNYRRVETLPDAYGGFHFGVIGSIDLGFLFIQPEFLYTETGQELMMVYNGTPGAPDLSPVYFAHKFSHLTIPLLAGIKLGPLRLGGGPVASLLLDKTWGHFEDVHFDYSDKSLGFQLMAGLKVGNLMLDVKYQGSLTRFGESVNIGNSEFDFDTRPKQFIVSVGLLIF